MIKYLKYSEKLDGLEIGDGFFEGWPKHPDKLVHRQILKESYISIVAVDDETIIGFINSISDGILCANIALLEVLPQYRKKKVASKLLEKLLEELDNLYMIDLVCDDDLTIFYEKIGMVRHGNSMIIRNYKNQKGN